MSAINASQWQSDIHRLPIADHRLQWLEGAHRLVQAFKATLGEVVMAALQETRGDAFADEKKALQLKNEKAHIRQVVIATQSGHSLCYARVIIPDQTYDAYAQQFSGLGKQFIGDNLLYNNKEVVRQAFEFACFDDSSSYAHAFFELCPDNGKNDAKLWVARRSLFLWRNCPLLISEFLLPYLAIVPYTHTNLIHGENNEL